MAKQLCVALIGYGYWGPNLLRNFYAHPDVRVKSVADLSEKNLHKVRLLYPSISTTTEYRTILRDSEIDAVVLAVPTAHHFRIAKEAVLAGKHVFVEKPMTQTVVQAKKLVELARKSHRHICVDHPFVFSEPIKYIKQLIDSGELGTLYSIESSRMNLGLFQKDINVVEDLGPHDFSIVDYLLDQAAPQRLAVFGSHHVHQHQCEQAHVHLQYASGCVATFHLSWLSPLKIRQMIVIGEKKMVVFDDTQASDKIWIYDKGVQIRKDQLNPFQPVYRSGDVLIPKIAATETLANVVDAFVHTIRDDAPTINDAAAGLRIVEQLAKASRMLNAAEKNL